MDSPAAPSPSFVPKMTPGKRLLVALAVIGAVSGPADTLARDVPYQPRPLFDRALAADKKGGLELFAIARYRAYLAAAPKAGNARRVRQRIIELGVEVEAKVRELLDKAAAAAALLSDENSRLQAFRRIAAILALAGDVSGAGKIAASLPSAYDRDFIFMNIAIARIRNGDLKTALKDAAAIKTPALAFSVKREITWVQAYSGDIPGAWKTAASISDNQEKSRAFVKIAEAEFSASHLRGAHKALAEAKKAASRLPMEVLKSHSYARVLEAQIKGGDISGARETADLITYRKVRARVDGLLAKTPLMKVSVPPAASREEIDAWVDIAETRLNKPHFVDFRTFWQSLRHKETNEIVEELLTVSKDFIDVSNMLHETEMLWWPRRRH